MHFQMPSAAPCASSCSTTEELGPETWAPSTTRANGSAMAPPPEITLLFVGQAQSPQAHTRCHPWQEGDQQLCWKETGVHGSRAPCRSRRRRRWTCPTRGGRRQSAPAGPPPLQRPPSSSAPNWHQHADEDLLGAGQAAAAAAWLPCSRAQEGSRAQACP